MADTQLAPADTVATEGDYSGSGSLSDAHQALLGLLEPEEDKPKKEEATPEDSDEEESEGSEEEQEEDLEDDESDDETEEPSDESDETEEEDDEDPLYAVKVDGEDLEIPLSELLSGYSRQSAFTKKSQALAEQRKEFENAQQHMGAEYQQIQQERQHYIDSLQRVIENSAEGLGQYQSVDWDRLKADDPMEYLSKREELRESQDRIRGLQQQQADAMQKAEADFQKQHQESLQSEHVKMIEALPEWGEPEKQREIGTKIRDYAITQGFQQQELDSLTDSRSLLVLRKAMLFDDLQNADLKGKKLKNKPRVIRAGKGAEKKQSAKKQRDAQMKRLRTSGHVNDAASLFEDFVEL